MLMLKAAKRNMKELVGEEEELVVAAMQVLLHQKLEEEDMLALQEAQKEKEQGHLLELELMNILKNNKIQHQRKRRIRRVEQVEQLEEHLLGAKPVLMKKTPLTMEELVLLVVEKASKKRKENNKLLLLEQQFLILMEEQELIQTEEEKRRKELVSDLMTQLMNQSLTVQLKRKERK